MFTGRTSLPYPAPRRRRGKDKHGKEFTRTYVWVDTWMELNCKWQCIAEGVMDSRKEK